MSLRYVLVAVSMFLLQCTQRTVYAITTITTFACSNSVVNSEVGEVESLRGNHIPMCRFQVTMLAILLCVHTM